MPFLNSAVFYRYLPAGPWELTDMPPRAMARAVERGELQAGPLPVAEVFRLGNTLRPLGDIGVAATGPATSVLLFSQRPVGDIAGGRVGLTTESATSVQLVRILFRDWWRVEPGEYVDTDEPNDAVVLIGDRALQARNRFSEYPYRYDLGEEWYKLTGLPFVFGALADKDAAGMFDALGGAVNRIICTPIASPRARPVEALVAAARASRCDVPIEAAPSPVAALSSAWRTGPVAGVAGSVYLVGEVLRALDCGRLAPGFPEARE